MWYNNHMQDYISFQTFSDVLNASTLALFAVNIIILIAYFTSNKFKNFISGFSYQFWVGLSALLLLGGIVGANIYDVVYGDAPCLFCWYQRIAIYPMFIIAVVEMIKKTRAAHVFMSVLATATVLLAGYHYSYHFRRYVLDQALSMPCSPNPLVAGCEQAKVVSFGFATMPMMSLIVGIAVLTMVYFMYKKTNSK